MTRLRKTPFHLPYNPDLIPRAKTLRQNMTPAEKKLWYHFLRNLPIRILRQRPIDHFIIDFYCPARKLVIEIDGAHHGTEQTQIYDQERTLILKGYGLDVIRFTNQQVMNTFEEVCSQLQHYLLPHKSTP